MKKTICLLLLCFSCTTKPPKPDVRISLINNSRLVEFKGIDYAILSEINRDSTKNIWQSLIPVYRMPADTDMKDYQTAQPGVYQLTDSTVIFTPDTPFVKGQTYFIRYFEFDKDNDKWAYIKGTKKLGKIPHIDLIFKK